MLSCFQYKIETLISTELSRGRKLRETDAAGPRHPTKRGPGVPPGGDPGSEAFDQSRSHPEITENRATQTLHPKRPQKLKDDHLPLNYSRHCCKHFHT